jgi:TRAP-type C4-dicarboxylate transport system substrate-binding protein
MDVFPASQLGKETNINGAYALGTVDVIYTRQAFAAHVSAGIGGAPFIFRDFDLEEVLRRTRCQERWTTGKGGSKPDVTCCGVRHTTSNRAINMPATAGLKLRYLMRRST